VKPPWTAGSRFAGAHSRKNRPTGNVPGHTRWRDDDQRGCEQRLVEVLTAYGYHDPDDAKPK
jgi:hypothetical protein